MVLDALLVELDVVGRWRAAHAAPLTRVAANLRHYVAEASGRILRRSLKRMETVRDKLDREPGMVLSRMHDIVGARAVLADQTAVDRVLERLREQRRWDLMPRTWDYVAHPKPDGYRAKHLVVRKDGVLIEVQLRTATQHAWAELVEQLDRDHVVLVGADSIETVRKTHSHYFSADEDILASVEKNLRVAAPR